MSFKLHQHQRVGVLFALLALIASLLVATAPPAQAAQFLVTSNRITDSADDDPKPDGCQPGDCSLREAVIDANAAGGADRIAFETTGTIRLVRTSGVETNDATWNDLDVSEDLTIEGPGITVRLGALGTNDHSRGFEANADFTVSGLNVVGARCTCSGGAIFIAGGSLTVEDATFRNNRVEGSGGAIGTEGLQTLSVEGSMFSDNHAGFPLSESPRGGDGGAIAIEQSPEPVALIDQSQFLRNSATYNEGGGEGGAVFQEQGRLAIANSWFDRNGSRNGEIVTAVGGAVSSNIEATAAVVNTTVLRNKALAVGGGLALAGNSAINRSAVIGNEVTEFDFDGTTLPGRGGGILMLEFVTLVINTTVHDNIAPMGGAGVHLGIPPELEGPLPSRSLVTPRSGEEPRTDRGGPPAAMAHVTVTDNHGGGDGVYVEDERQFLTGSSIIAGHEVNCGGPGSHTSEDYNIESGSDCGFAGANDLSGTDPLLGPAAINGGPPQGVEPGLMTISRLPQPGSPAIDSASPAICGPVEGELRIVFDQRTFDRPYGPACDRGAIEVSPDDPDPDEIPDPEDPENPDPEDPDPDDPDPDDPDPDNPDGPDTQVLCDATTGVDGPAIGDGITRIQGLNRIQTAIVASQAVCGDGQAPAVVLTRADLFPDAQAGTPLAIELGAPLLLSNPSTLDSATETEIQRVLQPGGTVYLLGGTVALSDAVDQRLRDLGYATTRYGGINRFETAAIIAADGLDDPATLLVTNGGDFADSVIAGAAASTYRDAAGNVDAAVVLTSGEDVSPETATYLAGRADSPSLTTVGGSAGVAYPAEPNIAGPTRFDTAVDVAETYFDQPVIVGVARADDFADALTGGAVVGRPELGPGPMLLTDTNSLPDPVRDWLEANATNIDKVVLFGGTAAISADVETAIQTAITSP